MRIAEIATGLAAVVAVPMAMQATAPSMDETQFVAAVRCAAYADAASPGADLAGVKYELNAEARRQPTDAVAAAAAEARAARQAVISKTEADAAMVDSAANCGARLIATDQTSESAV